MWPLPYFYSRFSFESQRFLIYLELYHPKPQSTRNSQTLEVIKKGTFRQKQLYSGPH